MQQLQAVSQKSQPIVQAAPSGALHFKSLEMLLYVHAHIHTHSLMYGCTHCSVENPSVHPALRITCEKINSVGQCAAAQSVLH